MAHAVKPRPLVSLCYGHLSGVVGEALYQHLTALGWIEADYHDRGTSNERITPAGLSALTGLGVALHRLQGSKRKPTAVCLERHQGQMHDHVGAHLGTLLREWLERQGWVVADGDGLRVTDAGRQGLAALGVTLPQG